jgi:hypothetical protein
MSGATPAGTKLAADLKVGDRICYTTKDLQNAPTCYTRLSSEVLRIIDLADDKLEILTTSGPLKVCSKTREFEVIGSDYEGVGTQVQYTTKIPEKVSGKSIE